MRPTKLLPLVCLMGSLLLTGCNSSNKEEQSVAPATTSEQVAASILSFVQTNQIRFDIMDDLGVAFKYGDSAVTSTQSLELVKDKAVTFTGELSVESVNFIVVTENKDGANVTCAYNPEILKAGLAEYLQSFATDYLNSYVGGRAYVAISNGANEGKWTKGLNAELDTKIQRQIDASKALK
jgi:hypothetical protein